MDIKYLGHSSFLLKGKTGTLVTDPFAKEAVGLTFPKVEASVVTVSHEHGDHSEARLVGGDPLIITLPGEYEKSGVRITGYPVFHDTKQGVERGRNTMYKIEMEDVALLHCGDLGHTLSEELVEEIDQVDVLLVPVGGHYTIGPKEASRVVQQIEPSLVVPMHYAHPRLKKELATHLLPVSEFLTEMGVSAGEPEKRLKIKKQDLGEEMKVVVMEIA